MNQLTVRTSLTAATDEILFRTPKGVRGFSSPVHMMWQLQELQVPQLSAKFAAVQPVSVMTGFLVIIWEVC